MALPGALASAAFPMARNFWMRRVDRSRAGSAFFGAALPAVFFLLPNARDPDAPPSQRAIHHVVSPPHTFYETADGSLKIRESIGAKDWHGLNAAHVWSLWTRYACTAFYAHPSAWNEIGFPGPAYPRGYKNPGVDARESFEVADVIPSDDPVQGKDR